MHIHGLEVLSEYSALTTSSTALALKSMHLHFAMVQEALTASNSVTSPSMNTRQCHCNGTFRSLESSNIKSIDKVSENGNYNSNKDNGSEEELDDDEGSVHTHVHAWCSPLRTKGKSPYLEPSVAKGKGMSRSKSLLLMHSPKN